MENVEEDGGGEFNINYKDKFCFSCTKRSKNLLKCAKCKNVYYCNRDCQVKDWKSHKEICGKEATINLFDQIFNELIRYGVYYYTLSGYNKYVIDYNVYRLNIFKIEEETKYMEDNFGDKILRARLSGNTGEMSKIMNIFNNYNKKMSKMGITQYNSSIAEWKRDILNFNILEKISNINKNYIKVDNSIIWIESGRLVNPNDEEKLMKLNKEYIDTFSDVFDHLRNYRNNTIAIDTLIYQGKENETYCIYHIIHDENRKITFFRGKIFFIDIELKD